MAANGSRFTPFNPVPPAITVPTRWRSRFRDDAYRAQNHDRDSCDQHSVRLRITAEAAQASLVQLPEFIEQTRICGFGIVSALLDFEDSEVSIARRGEISGPVGPSGS
jgi:hypothetical protein